MCRNIKPLFNFEPVATDQEIEAASLQFVRKITGMRSSSQRNSEKIEKAIREISRVSKKLLLELETNSPPKDRAVEEEKARQRSIKRFGPSV